MTSESLPSCLIKKCFDLFVWIILYKYTRMHQKSVNLPATGRKITGFHHFYSSLAELQRCLTLICRMILHLEWAHINFTHFSFALLHRPRLKTIARSKFSASFIQIFWQILGRYSPKVGDRYLRRHSDAHSVRLKSTIPTVNTVHVIGRKFPNVLPETLY